MFCPACDALVGAETPFRRKGRWYVLCKCGAELPDDGPDGPSVNTRDARRLSSPWLTDDQYGKLVDAYESWAAGSRVLSGSERRAMTEQFWARYSLATTPVRSMSDSQLAARLQQLRGATILVGTERLRLRDQTVDPWSVERRVGHSERAIDEQRIRVESAIATRTRTLTRHRIRIALSWFVAGVAVTLIGQCAAA